MSAICALDCKFSLLHCLCCPRGIGIAFLPPLPPLFSYALSLQNYKWWINLTCISAGLKKLLDSKVKVMFFHCSAFHNSLKWSQLVEEHRKIIACLNAPASPEADEETASELFQHQSSSILHFTARLIPFWFLPIKLLLTIAKINY